ncbi:uncharacterized protein LOC141698501 isoform X1 [Apium graveolens]|uniref:uncharacterized protein LOC141698501 isoform X1 n=2 Tax=Apium graveolens TaxID=4045 RepID=UPI003D78C1ED
MSMLFRIVNSRSTDKEMEWLTSFIRMDYAGDAITDKGDIWRSWSKYFYGCCKASNGFAKAEEITQENRYSCIATSCGLNQQRTGVAIMVEERKRKMNWANYVEGGKHCT